MSRTLRSACFAAVASVLMLALEIPAEATTPLSFTPYQAYRVGSYPASVAIGDVTGDGRPDVLLSTTYYFDPTNDFKLFVFPQQVDGSLGSPIRLGTDGQYNDIMGLDTGDLNGDGRTDVALAVAGGVDVFFQGLRGGLLRPKLIPTPARAFAPVIADVNGDGRNDIVVNTDVGVFLLAASTGARITTSTVTTDPQSEVEVGDVTGDGLLDIVGCSGLNECSNTVNVFEQRPDDAFQRSSYPGDPRFSGGDGIGLGDVNGDGRADVVLAVPEYWPNGYVEAFPQTASGTLGPFVEYTSDHIPEPIEVADMNGDGLADVVTLHGGWSEAGVYLQDAGALSPESLYGISNASHFPPKALALGDVNSDGRPDIVVADSNTGLVVLRQQ
jgi:hypothetical protein